MVARALRAEQGFSPRCQGEQGFSPPDSNTRQYNGTWPIVTRWRRLGGAYPIAVVVDDFVDRLLVNDILNANPAIREARERVPRQGLKVHVTTLVCQATGGAATPAGT